MTFDRDAFHRRAVQTPSHEEVKEMRSLLLRTVNRQGYDPTVDDAGNVVVTRSASPDSGGLHLVLNTHLDTVPPHVPYGRDGDVVTSRGACDAKGPLAALLDAFLSATVDTGRVTLAVTPDEETAQHGGAHLAETLDADGYVVGEPTGLDVCPAARGSFGGRVTITGESAHAGAPAEGVNPLEAVGPVVAALNRYDHDRGPGPHDLLGPPDLTSTRVESTGPLNRIPEECTVSFDRRPVPPETVDSFFDGLGSYLVDELPARYGIEVAPAYPDSPDPEAFASDPDATLVRTLARESGGEIRPFEAATEASYFAADAPTVVFGPGVLADEEGPVAHSEREYVSRSAVADAADAVRRTVEALI